MLGALEETDKTPGLRSESEGFVGGLEAEAGTGWSRRLEVGKPG